VSVPAFELPGALEAGEPPEERGLARDEVRLMVARRGEDTIEHARFRLLPELLAPGDLLVVNVSATLPAAIGARAAGGTRVHLHVSTPAPGHAGDCWWTVELRAQGGRRPYRGPRPSAPLALDGGGRVEIAAPYARSSRLWLARFELRRGLLAHLAEHGHPIRYGHVPAPRPLAAHQTVYAAEPGSAEMPSAGRPFTPELLARLVAAGVLVAPVVLHTGVSSPERHEPPFPERYAVPPASARLVEAVRGWGGRVVAVGTSAVRALETAARGGNGVRPGRGWTDLVSSPASRLRAVDGLITGWHEPQASHLQLLEAVAGTALLQRSYRAALEHGYLWHEFGDSHLILP
jgi:S-adenosylmethionine:tRNA ribosyltransferase-isomerase